MKSYLAIIKNLGFGTIIIHLPFVSIEFRRNLSSDENGGCGEVEATESSSKYSILWTTALVQ